MTSKPIRINASLKLAFSAALVLVFTHASADENDWPIEPVNADHPLGSTLGELAVDQSGGFYQHQGIDILATPYPDPSAPNVVVKADGAVDWVNMSPNGNDNFVRIIGTDGITKYTYHHLEFAMLSLPLQLRFNNKDPNNRHSWPLMSAGDRIGQIHDSFVCNLDHLHYEVGRVESDHSITLLNPLVKIEPKPDPDKPEIKGIFLARNGREEMAAFEINTAPNMCTTVSGSVDIIAEIQDRDNAGSTLPGANDVGIYNLQWRACSENSPECEWNGTHVYRDMPGSWSHSDSGQTTKHFSLAEPWKSIPEEWTRQETSATGEVCPSGPISKTFLRVTDESFSGPWLTAGGAFPNGKYVLSVKASDIAKNDSIKSLEVCVDN